jgi:hypothetical protein
LIHVRFNYRQWVSRDVAIERQKIAVSFPPFTVKGPIWNQAERPLVCRSVGWLLHDTDMCKVVVPHITNTDDPTIAPQGCGDMTIPSCAVTRMIDLREAG